MLIRADVVRRDVRKDAVVKEDAAGAMQHESLARDLHDHRLTAGIRHFPEILLNLIGLRGRVLGHNVGVADCDTVGPDESGLDAARREGRAGIVCAIHGDPRR